MRQNVFSTKIRKTFWGGECRLPRPFSQWPHAGHVHHHRHLDPFHSKILGMPLCVCDLIDVPRAYRCLCRSPTRWSPILPTVERSHPPPDSALLSADPSALSALRFQSTVVYIRHRHSDKLQDDCTASSDCQLLYRLVNPRRLFQQTKMSRLPITTKLVRKFGVSPWRNVEMLRAWREW